MRGGKGAGMQFRIAAGKPAAVAAFRRRLVGEWRERHDFRAGMPPAVEDVRIDEGEGRVARPSAMRWPGGRSGGIANARAGVEAAPAAATMASRSR